MVRLVVDDSFELSEFLAQGEYPPYEELVLDVVKDLRSDLLKLVHEVTPLIKSVLIRQAPWLDDDSLEIVTSSCIYLECIRMIGPLPNMTRLGIESIGRNCLSIKKLHILHQSGNDREDWDLRDEIFVSLLNHSSSILTEFSLQCFPLVSFDAAKDFLFHHRSLLVFLDLSKCSWVDGRMFEFLVVFPELRTLILNGCSGLSHLSGHVDVPALHVTKLSLTNCANLTDDAMKSIAARLPALESIDLSNCPLVTKTTLCHLSRFCKRLHRIHMCGVPVDAVPSCVGMLDQLEIVMLHQPPVCLKFPDCRTEILQQNLMACVKVAFIGASHSGKSSLIGSLLASMPVLTDGDTFGIPVSTWKPFQDTELVQSAFGNSRALSVEESLTSLQLWDCSGRKALAGVYPLFISPGSLVVMVVSLTKSQDLETVGQVYVLARFKAPGSTFIIVATYADVCDSKVIEDKCERIMNVVKAKEEEILVYLSRNLQVFSDMGLKNSHSYISMKRLASLPSRLHPSIIVCSNVDGLGHKNLRDTLMQEALRSSCGLISMDHGLHANVEWIYQQLSHACGDDKLFITSKEALSTTHLSASTLLPIMQDLESMGRISVFRLPAHHSLRDEDRFVICPNLPKLAAAMSSLHLFGDPQAVVNRWSRSTKMESIWPTNRPNNWTLRSAVTSIVEDGIMRAIFIPVCLQEVAPLSPDQVILLTSVLRSLGILCSGSHRAVFDMELLLPNFRQLSVTETFHMPLQNALPSVPQVNLFLRPCPSDQLEVGLNFVFHEPLVAPLERLLLSSSLAVDTAGDLVSFWSSGVQLRYSAVGGLVSISCNGADLMLVVRVEVAPTRWLALHKAWVLFSHHFLALWNLLERFPGALFKIVPTCLPKVWIDQLMMRWASGLINDDYALWFFPIDANSSHRVSKEPGPSTLKMLLELFVERFRMLLFVGVPSLQQSGKDLHAAIVKAGLSCQLVDHLSGSTSTAWTPKIHVVVAGKGDLEHPGLIELLQRPDTLMVDLDNCHSQVPGVKKVLPVVPAEGTSTDRLLSSEEITRLIIDSCVELVVGCREPDLEPVRLSSRASQQGEAAVSLPMTDDSGLDRQASSAAAASMVAERVCQQSSPTLGAKAAIMVAETAQAVNAGDARAAFQAVVSTAVAVDEAVDVTVHKQTMSRKARVHSSSAHEIFKSSLCLIL